MSESVRVVYQLADGGLNDNDLREATVKADSLHKGEVEMAVAEKHGVSYMKVNAVKWGRA
jgi:hypothetical protein